MMEGSRPLHHCAHVFFLSAFFSLILCSHLLQTLGQHLPILQEGEHVEDETDVPRAYVVFVREPEDAELLSPEDLEGWHRSFLPSPTFDCGKRRLIYSYRTAISGFAAWLTPREVEAMREMEAFVDAEPDGPMDLQTTHTPKFLGLTNASGIWKDTSWGAGRLIGVLDTGIDHRHVSFAGAGMPPFPRQWTGSCDFNCDPSETCTCTRKLLGARTFNESGIPALPDRDAHHGTAVASVAAGDFVGRAVYKRYARGTASGAAPGSYLSFYNSADRMIDTLKAIDQAIRDEVEILSISMANSKVLPSHPTAFVIGTLRAVEYGVLVSMAAGNYGPQPRSVTNVFPWQMTVGACSDDRAMEVTLVLHAPCRRVQFHGIARAPPDRVLKSFTVPRPLVYPGASGFPHARTCNHDLGGVEVTRAVVLCWRDPNVSPFVQAATVKASKGATMVLMNNQRAGNDLKNLVPFLPVFTVAIGHRDSNKILRYFNSGNPPHLEAHFTPFGTTYGVHPYPVVPSISGRGPSGLTSGILKPDIIGPGVYILAASNHTTNEFTLNTGTSLATPHLSAVAALLKSLHPDWSPAAIRSAIMTTADTRDSLGRPITDQTGEKVGFNGIGAGLVNPERAADPGLVYDIPDTNDYLRFVCSLGYDQQSLNRFSRTGYLDCTQLGKIEAEQLNYPSVTMVMERTSRKTITRTVTNVGPARSEYRSRVDVPATDVSVTVSPPRLSFRRENQRESFTVTVQKKKCMTPGTVVEGYLRWERQGSDHEVTSPLTIIFP